MILTVHETLEWQLPAMYAAYFAFAVIVKITQDKSILCLGAVFLCYISKFISVFGLSPGDQGGRKRA